jgi:hypothetical protein
MGRRKKWDNEEMWRQATTEKRGGSTYRDIAGRLCKPENMNKFGLIEAPGEDTVRREVKRRLAARGEIGGKTDPELGPHGRELFYLGQRFRDLARVPLPHEVLTVMRGEYKGRMWEGWPTEAVDVGSGYIPMPVAPPDPIEMAVAEEMRFPRHDARKHSLFPAFQQHLTGHPCWERLGRMEAGCNAYGEACTRAYQAILQEARKRLPDISDQDTEQVATSLLVDAWHRGRGAVGLEFTYGPHKERVQGADSYRLHFGAWMSDPVDDPGELQPLLAVHQDLHRTPPYEEELRNLAEADAQLSRTVQEFRQSLTPDASLRKAVLNGHCDLCPTALPALSPG